MNDSKPHIRYQLIRDGWGCLDCGVPTWSRDIHDEFHDRLDALESGARRGDRAMSLLTPIGGPPPMPSGDDPRAGDKVPSVWC